ncbi:ATP-binding protein [Kitasatospora sp. MMS16-BH015]|uniref:tetratricopeptide repeat protein n=1 Tax=Kitasatospora sp. MMS16-BH015 TaxID=2018025 RepID=UPI000CA2F0B0|nr:tetratricopeptide repeat protein [Kitasatospora sp. MMS16-BH015]AUG75695.1 ATP-binding protein [Kitasatospora sp. MMS16-BH015]
MNQVVYIAAAAGEDGLAELLAAPLRAAGYEVVSDSTVLVGSSLVEAATGALEEGCPVVLCATRGAVREGWPSSVANAAQIKGTGWLFVVQIDRDADVRKLAPATAVARYFEDPAGALDGLVAALRVRFPPVPPPPDLTAPARAGATPPNGHHLDAPSGLTEFDHESLRAFRENLRPEAAAAYPGSLTPREFLERAGLWTGGSLTFTGALLFALQLAPSGLNSVVLCSRYHGLDKSASRQTVLLEGRVHELIDRVRDFVAEQTRQGERPTPDGARSQPYHPYPMVAVREFIANALVHRDYTAHGVHVHVRIFEDRLEIASPGSWTGRPIEPGAPAVELDTLIGESVKRNVQLARMLYWTWLVEGDGSGLPTALADCTKQGVRQPTVRSAEGFVTVTLRKPPDPAAGLGRSETARPVRIGVVPHLAGSFRSRPDLLARAQARALVISGIGGVGKSQLAAWLAQQAADRGEAQLLVWGSATNREAVVSCYAEVAAELGWTGDGGPRSAARWFLNWLATTEVSWLVVLDDLADPADLIGLWPPERAGGRLLVTTRRRDAQLTGGGRVVLDMGVFTPEESVAYLTARLGEYGLSDPPAVFHRLAAELGHLPLALAQAAAFVIDGAMSCADYLVLLADARRRLESVLPQSGALPDGQRSSVADTWTVSVRRADELTGGRAGALLRMAAMLAGGGIPRAVLSGPAAQQYLQCEGGRGPESALTTLNRFSLVTLERDRRGTVRVHQLVQRVTRDRMTAQEHTAAVLAAADALLDEWPPYDQDLALVQALRENTEALLTVADERFWRGGLHPLFVRHGGSIREARLDGWALRYWDRLLRAVGPQLGEDHPDVLFVRYCWAVGRGEAGDPVGAVAELSGVVADQTRTLGLDHPRTLLSRHSLARFRGSAGDPAGAVVALEALLADQERVLGADHSQTLATRNDLAVWLAQAGDRATAVEVLDEVLARQLRVLGPDHPDTLTTRNNLALWRGFLGDAAGTVVALEALLVDQLRVFGPDHPVTLATRNGLATWRGLAGDASAAITAMEELRADQLRVFGPDHPVTLTSRSNLMVWRGEAGDPFAAATGLAELLSDRERVLGPGHPDVAETRRSLTYWLGVAAETAAVRARASGTWAELRGRIAAALGPEGASVGRYLELARIADDQPPKDGALLRSAGGPPWQELVERLCAAGRHRALIEFARMFEGGVGSPAAHEDPRGAVVINVGVSNIVGNAGFGDLAIGHRMHQP